MGASVAGFLQDMMAGTQGGAGVAATVDWSGVDPGWVPPVCFSQLKGALNVVWDVPPQATKGVANLLRTRAVAFRVGAGLRLVLLAALAASSVVSALGEPGV